MIDFWQLKDMAEMLPVGAMRNSSSPSFGHSSPTPAWDVSSAATEQPSSPMALQGAIPNGSNSLVISNGSDISDNRTSSQSEVSHCEATTKNKNRMVKAEPTQGDEWVEQDEAGVYITLVALPGGLKDLKRVRFRYFMMNCQPHLDFNLIYSTENLQLLIDKVPGFRHVTRQVCSFVVSRLFMHLCWLFTDSENRVNTNSINLILCLYFLL